MTLFTSAVRAILNTVCSSMAIGCAEAYTKTRRPFSLVWAQECDHIEDAYVPEHKIKGWRREKKIALIEGRFGDLPRLSRAGSHKQVEESS
jgi:putative endonuclease